MNPIELFSVKDKVVHVSGGSRGIGRAIAGGFAEAGARVVVSSRSETSLKATGLDYEVCDISDSAAIEHTTGRIVERFGRLDVLFNVAGINFRHAAETFPDDKMDAILNVNVRGNFVMARASGKVMLAQQSGKIVNIASIQTQFSTTGVSVYSASKGAVASMTRAMAVEWAEHNVQVNAIAPGFIRTDLNKVLWEDKKILDWALERTPARRLGHPGDLVGTALFLGSPASDFVTGQVLFVDGGFMAGSRWPLVTPR